MQPDEHKMTNHKAQLYYCTGGNDLTILPLQYIKLQDKLTSKAIICICDAESTATGDMFDVLCFVGGLNHRSVRITLGLAQLDELWRYICTGEYGSLSIVSLPLDFYIFVCCYGKTSCEQCGPIVADRFASEIEEGRMRVSVFKKSCVGEDDVAANVICYPSGDWYGNVKPSDVSRILKSLNSLDNQPHISLSDIWRGNMGKTNEEPYLPPRFDKVKELKRFDSAKERNKTDKRANYSYEFHLCLLAVFVTLSIGTFF